MNFILQRCLGLAVVLCCAGALAQPVEQETAEKEAQPKPAPLVQPPAVGDRNATLADQLPPEQVLWLSVEPAPTPAPTPPQPATGDTKAAAPEPPPPAPEAKFLARHIPDLSGEARGAVIILHDSEQHPSWPFTVAALQDDLPLHGWDTLSIELPAPAQDARTLKPQPAPKTPEQPQNPATPAEAASPAEKTADAQATPSDPAPAEEPPAPIPPEAQAQARIAAALRYLTEESRHARVAIIGFGSGAYRAAEFARQLAGADPAHGVTPLVALALIAPRNALPAAEKSLPALLPETSLPTLDMVLSSDLQARAEAEARRRAVLRQRERVYQRIEFPPINGAARPDHSIMVKRVRGFLQQQAGKAGEKAAATATGTRTAQASTNPQ